MISIEETFKDNCKFCVVETRICYYLRTAEQLGQVLIRVYLSIREAHAENSGLFSSHPFFIIVAHVAFLPSPIQHTLILIRTLFCSFTIQRILTAQIRGAPVRAGPQRVPMERHYPPQMCSVLGPVRYQSSVQLCPDRTFPYSSSRAFRLFITTNCQHLGHHTSQSKVRPNQTSLDRRYHQREGHSSLLIPGVCVRESFSIYPRRVAYRFIPEQILVQSYPRPVFANFPAI